MIRWVKSKKLAVLAEIEAGATDEEIFAKYGIEPHETKEWMDAISKYGIGGLRVTHTSKYRKGRSYLR